MAIATAYVPTEMPRMDVWFGDVLVNNSSAIVISDLPSGGSRKTEYFGSFSRSNYGEISGTLDSINECQSGTLIYSVKNIGADASQAYQAIQILADFDLAASIILGKDDTFNGSSGSDFLRSYNGNDVIYGNGGDDTLDGGAGNDTLTGGSGNDTFVKRPGESDDTITDFETGTGSFSGDRIDVSAYGLSFDQIGFETEASGLRVRLGADSILLKGINTPELAPAFFIGLGGSERESGTSAADRFLIDGDSKVFDGLAGIDTAVVSDTRNSASVSIENGYIYLSHSRGSVELYNTERVEFRDGAIAFDTEGSTSAGAAYRLYKAAFDRVPDDGGLGYWITKFDQGASAREVANAFVISGEFNSLYGQSLSNEGFVTALYGNVLDRIPDAGGLNYWLDVMANNPAANRAGVLASFSESAENIANTEPLTEMGIVYQPFDAIL
jgi:hypothetical protein